MNFIFDQIASHLTKNLPFVCFSKPNSDKFIGVFQRNNQLYPFDKTSSGFVFVSFDGNKKYLIPNEFSDIYVENIETAIYFPETKNDFTSNEVAQQQFESMTQKAIASIQNNEFQKVVLSRKIQLEIASFDLEKIINLMNQNFPNTFRYVFYHPELGYWIGASPEKLAEIEYETLKTVALAGTQVKQNSGQYVWQTKEIEEQKIVTDYIQNQLKAYSKSIHIAEHTTVEAGQIAHLSTTIEAIIEPKATTKIIELLHPTPAVCGFPKDKATAFIKENEAYDRDLYTGYFGEWNIDLQTYKPKTTLFVNLRCMSVKNNVANIYVGCGITKDSQPEKEFIETENKSKTMLGLLNLKTKSE